MRKHLSHLPPLVGLSLCLLIMGCHIFSERYDQEISFGRCFHSSSALMLLRITWIIGCRVFSERYDQEPSHSWYQRCLLAMLMPRLPMLTLSRIWSGRSFLGQTCLAQSFTRLMHLLRDVPKSFASFFNNFCIYKRVDVFSGHNTGNGTSTPKPSGMLLTPKVQLTQKLKKNTFLFHY